jgi:DNA-binding transcriptional ArsR family regulator
MRALSVAASRANAGDVFRAVADPTRRAILDRLHAAELSVNNLAEPFDMSQPAVSQHLRILLDAGLVEAESVGRQRLYRLNAQPLHEVFQWSGRYRDLFTDPAGHAWRIARARPPRTPTRTSKRLARK